MTGHLTDDEIVTLARKTVEKEPYSPMEIEQMLHMKECGMCYDDFCASLMLEGMLSPEGSRLLKKYYRAQEVLNDDATEVVKDSIARISDNVIAAIKIIRRNAFDLAGAMMEQISQMNALLDFQPVMAGATRGAGTEGAETFKLADAKDASSFALLDRTDNAILIQIDMKKLGCEEIMVMIVKPDGEEIPVALKYAGGMAKGLITEMPETDFELRITKK